MERSSIGVLDFHFPKPPVDLRDFFAQLPEEVDMEFVFKKEVGLSEKLSGMNNQEMFDYLVNSIDLIFHSGELRKC